MPCYVDMVHLERAREALRECDNFLAGLHMRTPESRWQETIVVREKIAAALDSTSHATDYMTQPVADYVPTATTITEAAAPAGPTPKEK